jgi:N-acetylmuramic acid 6-phosphate etherase
VETVSKHRILGVDGGATKTAWVLCEEERGALRILAEGRLGPGNMRLLSSGDLRSLLAALPGGLTHAGVYLAGCATEKDRAHLCSLAAARWPGARVTAGSDRESAFAAAFGAGDGITVIAGTGSAVTGRKAGREDRAGGWGHLLGDSGGGYDLAIRALRGILFNFDTARRITPLAHEILRVLGLNSLRDLTEWVQTARKNDLARLTPLIFDHVEETGPLLREGAGALAQLTAAVAGRLEMPAPAVRLLGGLFIRQKLYGELFGEALAALCPGARAAVSAAPAGLGAVRLALQAPEKEILPAEAFSEPALLAAPTEQANPRSVNLDRLGTRELVELFVREERWVEEALAAVADPLARAVDLIAGALAAGGRLFYAGAGTSGRLGVLDASEMPPTFGVDPGMVQALIAGGPTAIQQGVEGAEDDAPAGAQAVRERGVTAADVVCGITASGRTPFVRGALEAAAEIGAGTILLTCNPLRAKNSPPVTVEIDLPTGPELITGSTRLKAGTATKAALNILSSCAMVRIGRVKGNFMSCLQPTNNKLRERATRFVSAQLQISEPEARERLEWAKWNIPDALKAPVSTSLPQN